MEEKRLQEIYRRWEQGDTKVQDDIPDLIAEVRRLRAAFPVPDSSRWQGRAKEAKEWRDIWRERATQVEAQAAAMRAALERIDHVIQYIRPHGYFDALAELRAAFSGDAGKDYVHRSEVEKHYANSLHAYENGRAKGAAEMRERCAEIAKNHRRDGATLPFSDGQNTAAYAIEHEIRDLK